MLVTGWNQNRSETKNLLGVSKLETRLKSESFEPLIDFLAFLIQKL